MTLSRFFDWASNALVPQKPFSWTNSFETSAPVSHLQRFNLAEHQGGLIGLSVEHFRRKTTYTVAGVLGARIFPPARNIDILIGPVEILPLMTKAETLAYLASHYESAQIAKQNQGKYEIWAEQAKAALKQEAGFKQSLFPS